MRPRMLEARVTRFLLVGAGGAALFFGLSAALQVILHWDAVWSVAAAYALAFCLMYAAQYAWTFRATSAHSITLPRYGFLQLICGAFTISATRIFVDVFAGAPPLLISAVATIIAGTASYILSSVWVFSQRSIELEQDASRKKHIIESRIDMPGGDGASSGVIRYRAVATGLLIFACLLYVVVYVNAPIAVFANAVYDDTFFVRAGQHLASGEWLGPFDQMTLIKGPGYAIFLAVAAWLGIPSTLLQALLALAASGLFGWVVMRISGSRVLGLAIFLLVLWHPALFAQRIIRDAIYSQLTVLTFGALAFAVFGPAGPDRKIVWAAVAGGALGWFWLTREEGVWIAPGLIVLVLGGIVAAWSSGREALRGVIVPAGATLLVFLSVQILFAGLNYAAYGSFVGVDMKERQFAGALRAVEAAGAPTMQPYLVPSRAARQRLYAVSPSFASLRDYLDPPNSPSPWQSGCGIYAHTCGDIATGWFVWALRDAAAAKGHYASPAKARAFFATLREEAETACRQRRIECRYSWIPGIPPMTRAQIYELPKSMARAVSLIALRERLWLNAPDSTGSTEQLRNALDFTRTIVHTPPASAGQSIRLRGWFLSPDHGWFSISEAANSTSTAPVVPRRLPSHDLVQAFGDPKADLQRFDLTIDCQADCELKITTTADETHVVRGTELLGADVGELRIGRARLHLDEKHWQNEVGKGIAAATHFSRSVRSALARIYSLLLPPLLGIGLLALVGSFVLVPRRCLAEPLFWMAGTAWVLCVTRMLVLSLVDVGFFPAIDRLYMTPVYALSCIAALLSAGCFLSIRRQRPPQSAAT